MEKFECNLDRVGRAGTLAWRRLKKDRSYNDWKITGEAIVAGRQWAMHEAGTNIPVGSTYNRLMGDWLQRYRLDDMDKGERARLVEMMDNIGAIEAWRTTLTLPQRMQLNHPNSVVRRWRKATTIPERKEPKPSIRDSVVNLSEELGQAKARIAELEEELADARAQIAELEASPDVAHVDAGGSEARRNVQAN